MKNEIFADAQNDKSEGTRNDRLGNLSLMSHSNATATSSGIFIFTGVMSNSQNTKIT